MFSSASLSFPCRLPLCVCVCTRRWTYVCIVHICTCFCFRDRLMVLVSLALSREAIKDLKFLTYCQWLQSFLIFPNQFFPGADPPPPLSIPSQLTIGLCPSRVGSLRVPVDPINKYWQKG